VFFVVSCRSVSSLPDIYSGGERRAHLALQRAEEYMWKLRIAHQEFDQLTSQLERLRFNCWTSTRTRNKTMTVSGLANRHPCRLELGRPARLYLIAG